MEVEKTKLPGVLIVKPRVFEDSRGFFYENWHADRYCEFNLPSRFVQDNVSFSQKGTLRGLHFQNPKSQGKLVSVLQGEVFDVAVDIRRGSPSFGQWVGVLLSAENHLQLYVPEGFAHGFCVLSQTALFSYKCTEYYHPDHEHSIRWDDPELGIEWPFLKEINLSKKDRAALTLKQFSDQNLPRYNGYGREPHDYRVRHDANAF